MEKRVYSLEDDMEEIDLDLAPSLDLPALRTEKCYKPKDGGKLMLFMANVKKDWQPSDGCPCCHSTNRMNRSGRAKPRLVHDITCNNHCVMIALQPVRMVCPDCGQRFTPKIDGTVENSPMTERLVDYLKVESFLQPHSVLSERCGLSITTIQNIMDKEIDRYEQERIANPVEAPAVLGIDEKHIQHKMRGTIVDVENGRLLDMLEDNKEETMANAIMKLKDYDKNIRVVTMDMANSYIKWVQKLLPNATIVIDKFHVIQDVQKKITAAKKPLYEYRKELIEGLEDGKEKMRQLNILRMVNDNKRLFNYSMENIMRDQKNKRSQKLDTIMNEFPEFRLLRILYYYVEDMYTKDTRKDAEKAWDEWIEFLPPSDKAGYDEWCELYSVDPKCFASFQSLSRTGFQRFKPYILNYFNSGCRYTNAVTEGLNNLIGQINISGNGYRFRHLRAKVLYASLIHQRTMYTLDVKTITSWTPTMNYQGLMTAGSYGFGSMRETVSEQYVFRRRTKTGPFIAPDRLLDKRLMKLFVRTQKKDPVPELDGGEDAIRSFWQLLQPDDRIRYVEETMAFLDEED